MMVLLVGRDIAAEFGLDLGPTHPAVGGRAPSLTLETIDGRTLQFPEDFSGRLVLLEFWATWCGPCLGEIPHIKQVYDEYSARDLTIIGVSLDGDRESANRVAEFARQNQMPWSQVVADSKSLAAEFDVSSIPAAFLLDPDRGLVLAADRQLRGRLLSKTISKHLALVTEDSAEINSPE